MAMVIYPMNGGFVFSGINLPKLATGDKRSNMRQPKPDPVPPPQALYTQNPCKPWTKRPLWMEFASFYLNENKNIEHVDEILLGFKHIELK